MVSARHITAMAARGWTWEPEHRMFHALGGRDRQNSPIIGLRVSEWDPGEWVSSFGVPGVSYGAFERHPTPMAAADEAEAWLRGVLAPLCLPWLTVREA